MFGRGPLPAVGSRTSFGARGADSGPAGTPLPCDASASAVFRVALGGARSSTKESGLLVGAHAMYPRAHNR